MNEHVHEYQCYFTRYGDRVEESVCGLAPYSENQLRQVIGTVLEDQCDDFRHDLEGNQIISKDDSCGHSLTDHHLDGCHGEWFHSRCGSDHSCTCKRSREELISLAIKRGLM